MKRALKIIFAIIIIIAVAIGAIFAIKKFVIGDAFIVKDSIEVDVSDYEERLKEIDSEIPGMTKYDKLKAGLNPDMNDTDRDGLTDNDELNVYGSDPTKKSTAGDLYTDKYKVDNNMDVNKKYDYTGTYDYPNNTCTEVILNATVVDDFEASVEPVKIADNLDFKIFKEYRIYNYSGEIKIDVSNILKDNSISIENIDVYTYKLGSKAGKTKFNVEDNIISLKNDCKFNDMYYVYLVDARNDIKNKQIVDKIEDINKMAVVSDVVDYFHGIVIARPLLTIIERWCGGYGSTQIYMVDSGSAFYNNQYGLDMIELLNYMYGYEKSSSKYTPENVVVNIISEEEYQELYNKYETLDSISPSSHHFNGDVINQPLSQFLTYCYFTQADVTGKFDYSGPEGQKEIVTHDYTGDFDIKLETLPFGNFATELSPGGSCMGIAALTAKLHNKKFISPSDSFYYKNDTINRNIMWDLSTDYENETLLNPGLNDYKSLAYVSNNADKNGLITPKTDAEAQFLNMIGCYWKEGNDKIKNSCNYRYKNVDNYPIANMEKVKKQLFAGNILICGLSQGNGAHAINVYRYDEQEDGTIILEAYDSNYPTYKGERVFVKIIPKKSSYGYEDSFDFEYITPSYTITSVNADKYFLIFMDDEFNILAG